MTTAQTYKNWKMETDNDNILWLYIDKENASLNTIDRAVMEEFADIVNHLEANASKFKGIIITSAKVPGFIAGADISLFTKFTDVEQANLALTVGQDVLNKLEALPIPTVALIDGFCLGGGLELALACQYRIAEDSNKTRLGLPEVKLGIHPGWGGTVRLPKLIGALEGLNMILSGHTVNGKKAAKLGFVDAAVPRRQLVHAAKHYILKQPMPHKATFLQSLTNTSLARKLIAPMMRKKVRSKASPLHYPAPFDVLDNWEAVGIDSSKAYTREAKTCSKLFFSDTCHNLVRIFFLQEKMKGLATLKSYQPKRVHVIGAGTMGGEIAAWCALQGMNVTLQDLEPKLIAPAIKRAHKLYKSKLKQDYLVQQAMDRLTPDIHGQGIAKADVIIEAVVENLQIKQKIFQMVESKAKQDAILATNTSSIPLDEINTILATPERLVGIHFFNPVAKMMLVEIVKGNRTSSDVVDKSIAFVRKIDKLPLPVKSSPGFLVNRILMPYLLESVELLKEGVPGSVIDKAMTDFGMPMGPITLADTVGLDVCLSVANYLGQYFETPIPPQLEEMVKQGRLGRKTGEGFYKYDKKGKRIKPTDEPTYDKPLQSISDRLVLRMLNEAFACLREGVIENGDLLDAGMVFGTGFAPFRGGPIQYAKSQGIHELYEQYVMQQQAKGEKPQENQTWDSVAI